MKVKRKGSRTWLWITQSNTLRLRAKSWSAFSPTRAWKCCSSTPSSGNSWSAEMCFWKGQLTTVSSKNKWSWSSEDTSNSTTSTLSKQWRREIKARGDQHIRRGLLAQESPVSIEWWRLIKCICLSYTRAWSWRTHQLRRALLQPWKRR